MLDSGRKHRVPTAHTEPAESTWSFRKVQSPRRGLNVMDAFLIMKRNCRGIRDRCRRVERLESPAGAPKRSAEILSRVLDRVSVPISPSIRCDPVMRRYDYCSSVGTASRRDLQWYLCNFLLWIGSYANGPYPGTSRVSQNECVIDRANYATVRSCATVSSRRARPRSSARRDPDRLHVGQKATIPRTQVIEAGNAAGRREMPVLRTAALAELADVAVATARREPVPLVLAELALLRGVDELR